VPWLASFGPSAVSPTQLQDAHRGLWRSAFSPAAAAWRLGRCARQLSWGGRTLSGAKNGFYGLKRLSGNLPADAPVEALGTIEHEPLAKAAL
jgi:hypothetical protein